MRPPALYLLILPTIVLPTTYSRGLRRCGVVAYHRGLDKATREADVGAGPRRDPHEIKAMAPAALVEEFRPFVGSIVNRLRRQLQMEIEPEDLEAYAFEGLLEAQNRFDPEDGTFFATYAYYRIRGTILDGCRREGWLNRRRPARQLRALDELLETSAETARDAPRPRTLAEAVDRVAQIVDVAATVVLLSEAKLAYAAPVVPNQIAHMERRSAQHLVQCGLECLDDDEREVIQRHHFDGQAMGEISEVFGRSRSWVSRVNTRALEKMKDLILSIE